MNPQRLRELWNERAPRERALLAGGALAIALVVLYLFLWQPGLAASQRLAGTLPKLRAQLELMRAQQSEIAVLRKSAGTRGVGRRLENGAAVLGGARTFRQSVQRIDAASGERATVLVASADFDEWLRWVTEAQREAGARLERCRISALDAPGLVRAEATFVALGTPAKR
jgi:general secretion pathway protein M